MRWIHAALRTWFRGNKESTHRSGRPRKLRLGIEMLEGRLAPSASTFQSVIGLPTVQALYPYNGAGYSVAVLDTGIDYNDTDLGGGFGAGHRVIAGWNFVGNNANPLDDNGHGTNIAGIIGSSNASNPGIDPAVNLIALKVLGANNTGTWSNIDQGLQWVIAHKTQYNIVAVNLSIGIGNYSSDSYNLLETDLANLKGLGVFTAVAAGNAYTTGSLPGLAYPAVNPNVVSVGDTWTGNDGGMTWNSGATDYSSSVDQIVSSSQRSSSLSILAPGAWITSDGLNNTPLTLGGTSMATAVVSGAAVLLHQAYDETGQGALATQDNILKLMQATGVKIVDTNNGTDNVPHTGLTFKRLNLFAAVEAIGEPIPPPVLGPIANQTLPVGQKIVIPLSVSDPAGSPVSVTWTQTYLPTLAYVMPPVVISLSGANLSIRSTAPWIGAFSVTVSAADANFTVTQTFNVTEISAPILAAIPNQTMAHSLHHLTLGLSASDLNGAPITFSARVLPSNGQTAPVTLTVQGNQLTISPALSEVGTFTVQVSATDGHTTVSQTFTVTVTNSPPVLNPVAVQTIAAGQTSVVVPLSATDADGDALSFQAVAETTSAAAYGLEQQYGFKEFNGSYYTNLWGQNEKWLVGNNNVWYMLLPNGNLDRSAQSLAATLEPANRIAALGTAFYAQPELLWNAQPPVSPGLAFSFQGNQLTVQRSAGLTGVFFIDVLASDGAAAALQTFELVLN